MTPIVLLFLLMATLLPMPTTAGPNSFLFPRISLHRDVAEDSITQQDKLTPAKCRQDYLQAMLHRCRVGDRVCFADELQLEDVQELASYIAEMCCLLKCQPKTLERLCCRNQQGKCRQAKCMAIQDLGLLIEADP